MAESSETAKLSVRLLIDEEKNKVVLAETGTDFVNVLFSLLNLPMGTIVRLLKKHKKSSPQVIIGCFNNLYKSVSDMDLRDFKTESCKQMLLYPRSIKHKKFREIKLNLDDTEPVKFFVCPNFRSRASCREFYSISKTETCGGSCRTLMKYEIKDLEEEGEKVRDFDGIFVITDDLKVMSSSMDNVLNILRDLGYRKSEKFGEIVLEVGFNEVFTLLECLFTSDSPLTDTFLRKRSSLQITKSSVTEKTVQESGDHQMITVKAVINKVNSKILCIESGGDFIDLLFSFLVLPIESICQISGNSVELGCIGNLYRSFKCLNGTEETSSEKKCLIPSYYSIKKQLLDVVSKQEAIYCSYTHRRDGEICNAKFSRKMPYCLVSPKENKLRGYGGDEIPGAEVLYMKNHGFVWGRIRFLVTDDLIVRRRELVSNISLLKLQMNMEDEDIEEQVITIGKVEAMNLLRTSLMNSSALTTCFWNLITKKVEEEET